MPTPLLIKAFQFSSVNSVLFSNKTQQMSLKGTSKT